MEKFDFSKIEEQKKFEKLPEVEKAEDKDKEKGIVLTREQENVKRKMIEILSEPNREVDDAVQIWEKFSIPEEIAKQAAKEGMLRRMLGGRFYRVIEIKNKFSIPDEEFISSSEFQQIAKEGIIKALSDGEINGVIKIKEEFSVNITNEEIIEGVPEINNLLSELQKVSPEFHNQVLKSFDVLMSLFEFKDNPERFLETVKENPFLLDAVSENPKFGSKLLIKYPQLDELSQENIELLFDAKKEILASNPGIDPESLEFRQMMQEKLAEYESNPEIKEAIKEMGIDFDTWLNYSDTQYFSLESGKSEVAFSETIATPIKRIKETIDSYAYTIKSVLTEYRQELSEFQVPVEDPKEIEEKIAKMQEAMGIAKDEGNEKKAQGIEKAIMICLLQES